MQKPTLSTALSIFNTGTSCPLTMSSLEIAKLTGKEHFNFMRDIRTMLEELELGTLSFEGSYLSALILDRCPKRTSAIISMDRIADTSKRRTWSGRHFSPAVSAYTLAFSV